MLGDTTERAILVAAAKAGIDLAAEAARTPLVETNITTRSAARGKTVADLHLSPGDAVAAVVHGGKSVRADQDLRFRTGDRVLVVTSLGGEERVHDAFYSREPRSGLA